VSTSAAREVAERIESIKFRRGKSDTDIARALGVHVNTVGRWRRQEVDLDHPEMIVLALAALDRRLTDDD
jgi:transposase-like protein